MIAYAIAGTVRFDIEKDVLGLDADGRPISLKDIWPSDAEIDAVVRASVKPEQFRLVSTTRCSRRAWRTPATSPAYDWRPQSTYIRRPPYGKARWPGNAR